MTLATALQYTHYGAADLTVNNEYGTIDTRTKVGHVNRNVTITAGADSGWGFSVYVYGYLDGQILRVLSNQQYFELGSIE